MLAYQDYAVLTETVFPPYRPPAPLTETLSACSLVEDDVLRCYQRMTRDIATLSSGIARPFYLPGASHCLWEALTTIPASPDARWRQFYRRTKCLVTRSAAHVCPGTLHGEFVQALERLEHFVRENADLA